MTTNLLNVLPSAQDNRDKPAVALAAWQHQLDAALSPTSLTSAERLALAEFLDALQQHYRDLIENVILYGSAARGEGRVESDVDLLVLVRRLLSKTEQSALRQLADQTSEEHACILNALIMTPDEQQWHGRGSSLWRNIQRDGIALWQASPEKLRLSNRFQYRTNPAAEAYTMTEAQYDEIVIYLRHSDEELAAAAVLIQAGMERMAISRCYYAIFYAASALLLTKGILRAKHSGVRSAFGEHFIRSGLLPTELGDTFKLLQSEREMADYKMIIDSPWEDIAELRLQQATEFVAAIRTYLNTQGYLRA